MFLSLSLYSSFSLPLFSFFTSLTLSLFLSLFPVLCFFLFLYIHPSPSLFLSFFLHFFAPLSFFTSFPLFLFSVSFVILLSFIYLYPNFRRNILSKYHIQIFMFWISYTNKKLNMYQNSCWKDHVLDITYLISRTWYHVLNIMYVWSPIHLWHLRHDFWQRLNTCSEQWSCSTIETDK